MIYYVYFHLIMKYGIVFWGNSVDTERGFQLQKQNYEK